MQTLAFATFLVWRLRTGACDVGACGFWRYRMPPVQATFAHLPITISRSDDRLRWFNSHTNIRPKYFAPNFMDPVRQYSVTLWKKFWYRSVTCSGVVVSSTTAREFPSLWMRGYLTTGLFLYLSKTFWKIVFQINRNIRYTIKSRLLVKSSPV